MLSDIRKSLVRESYDQEAERYKNASDMQLFNLRRLLSLGKDGFKQLRPRTILDVGCGLGPAVPVLKASDITARADYFGIDLSPQMIAKARQLHESLTVRFAVGDAEALDVATGSIDLVLSNSALHWLNQPEFGMTPGKALAEMYRVLRPGGILAVSTAAAGKAERFLGVYRAVMAEWALKDGFDRNHYVEDPINRLHLHTLVDLALDAKFEVKLGQLHYQPTRLSHVRDYLDAVRAYGFTSFMAPIPPALREEVWADLCGRYTKRVGEGPYVHDYYVAYVIGHKPEE